MGRVKRGDIIVNEWATKNNPTYKGIYMGCGVVLSAWKGIHKSCYNTKILQEDAEHFIVVGHAPIDELFADMIEKYTNK